MKKIKSVGITCPTCGLGVMRKVLRNVTTHVGNSEIVVHRIPLEECVHCGERMYDMEALRLIRAAREPRNRNHAA